MPSSAETAVWPGDLRIAVQRAFSAWEGWIRRRYEDDPETANRRADETWDGMQRVLALLEPPPTTDQRDQRIAEIVSAVISNNVYLDPAELDTAAFRAVEALRTRGWFVVWGADWARAKAERDDAVERLDRWRPVVEAARDRDELRRRIERYHRTLDGTEDVVRLHVDYHDAGERLDKAVDEMREQG